jgi:hypothetical protein
VSSPITTEFERFNTIETVVRDTPAARATSWLVTLLRVILHSL